MFKSISFHGWDVYRVPIPENEDNRLHAVCRAYDTSYMTLKIHNHIVDQNSIISSLKTDLTDQPLSKQIRKNIFSLHNQTASLEDVYDPSKPSIVLLFDGSHYDVCAYRNADGSYTTHFPSDHSYIQYLLSKHTSL